MRRLSHHTHRACIKSRLALQELPHKLRVRTIRSCELKSLTWKPLLHVSSDETRRKTATNFFRHILVDIPDHVACRRVAAPSLFNTTETRTSLNAPLHSIKHQQLPLDVFQHLSDHWVTISKTKTNCRGFGFSMMLSFGHPSKNLSEGAVEKIQSSFGKSLKVVAIMNTSIPSWPSC